jgi:hypothetical protein
LIGTKHTSQDQQTRWSPWYLEGHETYFLDIAGGLCSTASCGSHLCAACALNFGLYLNLSRSSMVPANGPKYSYFGFEFESPWAQLKAQSETQGGACLIFVGGYGLMVLDPSKSGEQTQVWNNIASKFGERSRYELLSRVLNETPDDLHLTISPRKMTKTAALLNLKKIESSRIKTGLLSFHTDWMHGFQKGNPKDAETVYVDAFDDREREVQLEIKGPEKLNQEQINRLFSSRKVNSAACRSYPKVCLYNPGAARE